MKTVAAIKADKVKTIDLINKGEGGFLDRDLYPFCSNISDGKNVALGNPNAKQLLGVDVRTTKDINGKAFGQEFWDAYQKPEGEITEVSYMFVRPGPTQIRCRRLASYPRLAMCSAASAITSRPSELSILRGAAIRRPSPSTPSSGQERHCAVRKRTAASPHYRTSQRKGGAAESGGTDVRS
jgi:hypothetical protein